MERHTFGKTGLEVSALGFGSAEIGFESASVNTVDKLLGSALDAGLNVIDTAECYNVSEDLIGKTVAHRRNDFHLFTKCGHAAGIEGLQDWDPRLLEQSIDRSLKRLQTDRVELVQLHTCSRELLEQGDVIAVLQKARDAGKTRFIGYSGDNDAAAYAIACGAFDTLQTSINIADQQVLDENLPAARKANMGVIAKRPIANAAWKHTDADAAGYTAPYWERLGQLKYEFLTPEATAEAAGIALRFTLSQPGVHTAIVGTTKPDRWIQNARLLEAGALPQEQLEKIRSRWKEIAGSDWIGQG
jgi:hypothetical protein